MELLRAPIGDNSMDVSRSVYRINGLDTVPSNFHNAPTRPDSDGATSSSHGFDLMGVSRSVCRISGLNTVPLNHY